MKKTGILIAVLFATVSLRATETAFYTVSFSNGGWAQQIPTYWTVAAGTPAYPGWLGNDPSNLYTLTRVLYAGTVPTPDHSISGTMMSCSMGGNSISTTYLRASPFPTPNTWYEIDYSCGSVSVYVRSNGYNTYLGGTDLPSGQNYEYQFESAIQGSTITVTVGGSQVLSVSDSTLTSGGLGVGTDMCNENTGYACGFAGLTLSYTDTTPPTVPTGVAGTPLPARVNLSWNASTDNVQVSGYHVYRNGSLVGSPTTTTYTDPTVQPLTTYAYTVSAYDEQNNESAQSTAANITAVGSSYLAPVTGGPLDYYPTWGGGPEKLSLLTGALVFRLPLPKLAQQSSGPGFQMTAAWNSQFWSSVNGTDTFDALDTGYGKGFLFQIGSVYGVYVNNAIDHFEFQDSMGVIHKLMPSGSVYKSADSTYMVWNYTNRTLTFRDGQVWTFNCTSVWPEQDAGAYYPTQLEDTNGNQITITYQPGTGQSTTNSSSRITQIVDTLTTYQWSYYPSNSSYAGHVQKVSHCVSGPCYTDAQFTYTVVTNIVSPFCQSSCTQQTATELTQITYTGSPAPFLLSYDNSAELTNITFPYKGYFSYTYTTFTYSNGLSLREVLARSMSADGTQQSEQVYNFSHPGGDSSLVVHSQTTIQDPTGNKKIWYFIHGSANGWDNGLSNCLETWGTVNGSLAVLKTVDTTWTQDVFVQFHHQPAPLRRDHVQRRRPAIIGNAVDGGNRCGFQRQRHCRAGVRDGIGRARCHRSGQRAEPRRGCGQRRGSAVSHRHNCVPDGIELYFAKHPEPAHYGDGAVPNRSGLRDAGHGFCQEHRLRRQLPERPSGTGTTRFQLWH